MLDPQRRAAERQVRSAVLVATLLALFSLIIAARTWHERRYLDLEILLAMVDALTVLALALALSRRALTAAWLLLALTLAGAGLILWRGLPLTATLPNVLGAIFYVRAVTALRFLRAHPAPTGPGDAYGNAQGR